MRNFHQNGIISHFLIFNYSLFAQHLMHVGSSTTTVAHSKNYSSTTSNDVATCEDGWDARLHVVVHSDGVLSSQFQSFNPRVSIAPGIGTGLRRPLASGSPSSIF